MQSVKGCFTCDALFPHPALWETLVSEQKEWIILWPRLCAVSESKYQWWNIDAATGAILNARLVVSPLIDVSHGEGLSAPPPQAEPRTSALVSPWVDTLCSVCSFISVCFFISYCQPITGMCKTTASWSRSSSTGDSRGTGGETRTKQLPWG